MKSFHKVSSQDKRSNLEFLLALCVICLAYVLGNIPIGLAAYNLSQIETSNQDLIEFVQDTYGKTIALALLLMPWVFVAFSFWGVAKILKWPLLSFFTSRAQFDWKRFASGFVTWFVICTIQFLIFKNEWVFWIFQWKVFFPLFVVAALILFFQCLAEELLFRSFLLKWVGHYFPFATVQILVTGIVFGLLHGSNPEIDVLGKIALFYYIFTGIFLGFIAYLDKGLELTIGFHFANNFFAAIFVTSTWQVFTTDALYLDLNPASFGMTDVLVTLGGQSLFFLMGLLFYKWKFTRTISNNNSI